ncbi:MAG: ATP-binding protein [Steroidobacteraceae bacterium]
MRASRGITSETARLSALLIALFAASALVLGFTADWIAGRAMRAELRDIIGTDVGAIRSGFAAEGRSEAIEVVNQLTAVPGLSERILLEDPNGRKMAGNLSAMTPRTGVFRLDTQESAAGGPIEDPVIGEGGFLPDRTYWFVGENAEPLARIRSRLLVSFAWIIGVTIALAALGGFAVSAGFLRRIDAITGTCRAIVAGRFGERIPVHHSQAQLDRLSATINEMLDRIGALLESLRQVSSDIAHDLRTPLTRLRQRLESARTKSSSAAQYERVVDRALADCDAILDIFAALLSISQIESGVRLAKFAPVDLHQLLLQVAEIFAPVAEDGSQSLSTDIASGIEVRADRTLLLQMFSNLVENAIRHAGANASIAIACRTADGEAVVRIIDSGPGIPAAEREKVFGRLYRLERSRSTPGNGLGLALVDAIARLHHYNVDLDDAGPGLCVSIRIPLERTRCLG